MLSQQWQTLTQCYCIIEQSHLLKAVSAVLSMLVPSSIAHTQINRCRSNPQFVLNECYYIKETIFCMAGVGSQAK